MAIDASVTPFAVAPLALPGPHGDGSVPKVAAVLGALVCGTVELPPAVAAPLP